MRRSPTAVSPFFSRVGLRLSATHLSFGFFRVTCQGGHMVSVQERAGFLRRVRGGGDRRREAQEPPARLSAVRSVESVCLSWEFQPDLFARYQCAATSFSTATRNITLGTIDSKKWYS